MLVELKDTHSLHQLALCLKTKPEASKQYLRDNERVALYTKVGGGGEGWRREGRGREEGIMTHSVCVCLLTVQVVKLCVEVLVEISEEEGGGPIQGPRSHVEGSKVPREKAESYKTLASAVRILANKLDSDLIKASAVNF